METLLLEVDWVEAVSDVVLGDMLSKLRENWRMLAMLLYEGCIDDLLQPKFFFLQVPKSRP